MTSLLDATHLVTTYGYVGLFLVVTIESGIFFFLPGDSLLFVAGLLAPTLGFNILLLFIITFASAVLGSGLGYLIGTQIDRVRRYAIFKKTLKEEHIEAARIFFENHGRSAVFLARFMPVVRTFVPIAAGVSRMNKKTYARYAVLGALAWTGLFLLSGYYLGKIFPTLGNYLTYIIIGVVAVSILPGAIAWLRRRWKHSRTS